MADSFAAIAYSLSDFTALGANTINFPVLLAAFEAQGPNFDTQPSAIDVRHGGGIVVRWDIIPAAADEALSLSIVQAHTGAATTEGPFTATNAGPVTATTATAQSVVDLTTPALEAGTYHLDFSSQFRMQSIVNGEAARALSIVTINGGSPVTQQSHWDANVNLAYNGSATFNVAAGATVRIQLQIAEVGPGAGTAEMTQARATITRVR